MSVAAATLAESTFVAELNVVVRARFTARNVTSQATVSTA